MLQYKIVKHGEQDPMFIPPGVLGTHFEKAISGTGPTEADAGDQALALFYMMAPIDQVTTDDAQALEYEVRWLEAKPASEGKVFHVTILWRVVPCR